MKRCMIVDRSSVVRKVAKRILQAPEMVVVVAESGRQAVSMCEADMPDIILVDIDMPDMEIETFVGTILHLEADRRPHIVVTMNEMDLPGFMRAKRVGANDYMLKPFDRAILLSRFRTFAIAA
ncbi:MAG TPA: response regulator [Rhizobiaceae bacterium]|nr:response regulator [Rhizobiaceae bacterium]